MLVMSPKSEGLAPEGAPPVVDPDETSAQDGAGMVRIRRVEDAGSESVLSFPFAVGCTVVRFDADGFAEITAEQWEWAKPYATAQSVYRVVN